MEQYTTGIEQSLAEEIFMTNYYHMTSDVERFHQELGRLLEDRKKLIEVKAILVKLLGGKKLSGSLRGKAKALVK